jgi:hypothetical protein
MSSLKKLVQSTCTPDTPCQLVEVEGLKELIQYIRKARHRQTAILDILKHLKPYVKSPYPKPILAGLKVIEMLMIQIGKDFCDEVSSEEWTRRLRKLAVKTKEPILKMTVLQHLADWVEMFGMITDISYLNEVNSVLTQEYGISIPGPSANARDQAKRFRQDEENSQAKEEEVAAPEDSDDDEEKPSQPAQVEKKKAEDSDDSDLSDDEGEVEEEEEEEEDFPAPTTAQASNMVSKARCASHELRSFKSVHRSSAGKMQRRLARKTEKLDKLEAQLDDQKEMEYMRKVNRELADAQRQLLNLQYTWTTMESEVQELEWQESKGEEEFEAIAKQHKNLSQETEERRAEEKETLAELDQCAKELEELTASNKHFFGENLEECDMEVLAELKSTITKTLAALG